MSVGGEYRIQGRGAAEGKAGGQTIGPRPGPIGRRDWLVAGLAIALVAAGVAAAVLAG